MSEKELVLSTIFLYKLNRITNNFESTFKREDNVKTKIGMLLIVSAAVMTAVVTASKAEVFTIGAVVPSATGASFNVSKVTGDVFAPHASNNLDFGELDLDSNNGIFLAPYYFAIDVGGENGAGIPDIDIQYTDTGAPNGATTALGDHGTLSYASVVGNQNGDVVTTLSFMSLHQANGVNIDSGELGDGFLRINIGIATGNTGFEGDAVPFNLGSAPGSYTGTLTLTAVVN